MMKKSKILFPLTIENINPKSYCFAIDLARKLNSELIILATKEKVKPTDIFLRNRSEETLQQESHLTLLKLNGIYQGYYNQWNSFEDLSIKVISSNTEFNAATYKYFQEKKVEMVLFDYNTFIDKVYTTRLLDYLSRSNKRIWVIPRENEGSEMDPNVITKMENSAKNVLSRRHSLTPDHITFPLN